MMKGLKPRASSRPTAEEALRITASQASTLPPTQLAASDRPTTLNLRLRASTVAALTAQAKEEGLTQKQVVCRALAAAGISVAAPDLEDRTPRRRL
jgi:hypothetical protein